MGKESEINGARDDIFFPDDYPGIVGKLGAMAAKDEADAKQAGEQAMAHNKAEGGGNLPALYRAYMIRSLVRAKHISEQSMKLELGERLGGIDEEILGNAYDSIQIFIKDFIAEADRQQDTPTGSLTLPSK